MSKLKTEIEQIEHKTAKIKTLTDEILDIYKSMVDFQKSPCPLSKGDWVIIYTELALYLGEKTKFIQGDNIRCKVVLDLKGQERNYSLDTDSFTRIDTLTEEHLKMLDDDSYTFKLEKYEVFWYVAKYSNFNSLYSTFKPNPIKHKAIEQAIIDTIARRRLDREMGV